MSSAPTIYQQPINLPVTNRFRWNYIYGTGHKGDDHAAGLNHPVVAMADQRTIAIGRAGTASATIMGYNYGNWIAARTADGMIAFYAHLNKIDTKVGERNKRGTTIGLAGMTGGATGTHLHDGLMREWRQINTLINPSLYINNRTLTVINERRKYVTETYLKYVEKKPSTAHLNLWVNRFTEGGYNHADLVAYLKSTVTYRRLHPKK